MSLEKLTINKVFALIGMGIPASILLGALYLQFFAQQHPCPLCLLQRAGFIGYMIAMLMYFKYGYSGKYIAFSILLSLAGSTVSMRQILLHITSPKGAFMPLLGLHLYTWSFLAFTGLTLYSCFILLINNIRDP